MEQSLIEIDSSTWQLPATKQEWIDALEEGKVLHFPNLAFALQEQERQFLRPEVLNPKSRNISLDAQGRLKGALDDAATQAGLTAMMGRFRSDAEALIGSLLPQYMPSIRWAPTSYRPTVVETRTQSWRADDKRLHVDAFPSRPNYGERILRVFTNINPDGVPRVWRVGEPFPVVAERFLPRAKPYVAWQAKALAALHITKSLRSEYDHLMLQLHDGMKGDLEYQKSSDQLTVPFASGSTWVCFSDQTSHAAMSGQFMLEQTMHLPVAAQYRPERSPLAVLSKLTGRQLI
jgi:hypothetical protein